MMVIMFIVADGKFGEVNAKTSGQKARGKNGYVPRGERYNNLLDTAYENIVDKRKTATSTSEVNAINKKGQRKIETTVQPQNQPAPDTIKTPTVSSNFFPQNLQRYINIR